MNHLLRHYTPIISLRGVLIFHILCLLTLGTGCSGDEQDQYQPQYSTTCPQVIDEYILGVHPLHNPKRLHEIFGPITDYLSEQIPGARFKVEASRNYGAYDQKLYAGKFHFGLPNPYQTVNALKYGYRVFGKMADDENFRGIILVRKDSNINDVTDLKGKKVSFPAPTALAATMMPQLYLQQHGLDVMHDITISYVGSQESSIMNVFLGNVDAGSTWPLPWRALSKERPELAEALEIKWSTTSLPNNGLVVRDDVPQDITIQVAQILFNLHTHSQGQEWLKRMELSQFEQASNDTYAPVHIFLDTFNNEVRPIEH